MCGWRCVVWKEQRERETLVLRLYNTDRCRPRREGRENESEERGADVHIKVANIRWKQRQWQGDAKEERGVRIGAEKGRSLTNGPIISYHFMKSVFVRFHHNLMLNTIFCRPTSNKTHLFTFRQRSHHHTKTKQQLSELWTWSWTSPELIHRLFLFSVSPLSEKTLSFSPPSLLPHFLCLSFLYSTSHTPRHELKKLFSFFSP